MAEGCKQMARYIYVLGTHPGSHFSYIRYSRRLQMTMKEKLRHWKCYLSAYATVVAPVYSLKQDNCDWLPFQFCPLLKKCFQLALMDDRTEKKSYEFTF